jgi:predicted amidophosphoribosyltransferase
MIKDANVNFPKTKCDRCSKPAVAIAGHTAYCQKCQVELVKEAEAHDVYQIPPHNED